MSRIRCRRLSSVNVFKKGKKKVQAVPQLQAAAHPRHEEEEETDKTKLERIEQTYEKYED